MDYFAIQSNGVFPDGSPGDAIRSLLAVSQGLIDYEMWSGEVRKMYTTIKNCVVNSATFGNYIG